MYYNLFITFLVSGLWHGANWTFVIWGAFHGGFLVWEKLTEDARTRLKTQTFLAKIPKLVNAWSLAITFFWVVIGWIFFRAKNFGEAVTVLKGLAAMDFRFNLIELMASNGPFNFLMSLLAIGLLMGSYLLPKDLKLKYNLAFLLTVGLVILLFGKGGQSDFIYFQF